MKALLFLRSPSFISQQRKQGQTPVSHQQTAAAPTTTATSAAFITSKANKYPNKAPGVEGNSPQARPDSGRTHTMPDSPRILFCFSCWLYYSVIPQLDKGEAGALSAGDCPARQEGFKPRDEAGGWRTQRLNACLRGPSRPDTLLSKPHYNIS